VHPHSLPTNLHLEAEMLAMHQGGQQGAVSCAFVFH
jgi:hypothetical protein